MLLYEPNLTVNAIGSNLVEFNLPGAMAGLSIGDDYLNRYYAKPSDWRWRMPDLDAVKRETNQLLSADMNFGCSTPTLDSYAAFADDADIPADPNAVDIPAPNTDYTHSSPIGDINNPDAIYTGPGSSPATGRSAPNTTQNPFIDALTGIIRGVTPAIARSIGGPSVSQVFNPATGRYEQGVYNPATGRYQLRAAASSSSMMPALLIGAAVVAGIAIFGKR